MKIRKVNQGVALSLVANQSGPSGLGIVPSAFRCYTPAWPRSWCWF